MKPKLGRQRTTVIERDRKVAIVQSAFEDFNPLSSLIDIELKGRNLGALLLQPSKSRFCFVFGFRASGIHDTLRLDQLLPTIASLESGLKELLPNERLTIHLSSFTGDSDRQADLDQLMSQAPSPELRLILMSEKVRAQELKQMGVRKPKTLALYVTYTIESDQKAAAASDWIEKTLARGMTLWETFKGDGEVLEVERYQEMITRAFSDGYLRWEQLLNIKMGLEVQPMSVEALWAILWHRFNQTLPPPVPQRLILTANGLSEQIVSEIHPATLLIQGEKGQSTVPIADRRWLKVKGKYIGALTFTDKPGGFLNARSQLRYLWDVLCRPHVIDTEIFCQITPANPHLLRTNVQRILKQSNVTASLAQEKRSIDVGAHIKTKRSVQAQEKLYEGALPVNIGTVFLVHRSSPTQLDEACSALSDCFQLPAKVIRETEITWQLWLQTLPISWDKLLGKPYRRQLTYLSSEAPGLMPLTMTRPGSARGFEMIADEGGSPIKINFIEEHRNIAVFGTTRSGKSVMVSGMLTEALAAGLPIVALDYPKPDGTSTFTDYASFLKPRAAYFDIGKESNNLMEQPDLRGMDDEQRRERFEDYKSFLESAIVTMVLPSAQEDALLEQTVRSLIGKGLTLFFDDLDIQRRYAAALEQGFGSDAWAQTPTLKDFLSFCTVEKLGIEEASGLIRNGQSQIQLQLEYWLNSRVGRAIGQPSSFPTDAQLLVFALRNLSNENEAAILSLSAYSAALRRALASPRSIFFIDESPILFAYSTIARLIGRLCANGAKAGIRVFLSGQDPDTICNSIAGQQIMQNMSTRMVGRIQPMAIDSFVRLLQYERLIIAKNASESFFPKRSELYSNWLLDIDGVFIYCRYYPGAVQLAIVANNPDEQLARSRVMAHYPNDKYMGTVRFAAQYTTAIRSGYSLEQVGESPRDTPVQEKLIYAR
ncbi:MAG TPA: hypothetical protein V6C88_03525 [Chroococcidiopsis sp.]